MITARIRRFSVFLSLVLLTISQAPASIATGDPLDAVRARFAPDRRLTVFDVKTEPQGDAVVVRGEVESTAARDAALEAVRAGGARVVDQITILPAADLGDDTQGIIRVSVANVRGKPGHAAEMVTQALLGWPVRVLKEQSGWYLVHTEPDGYLGWIEDLQLARMTPPERDAWQNSPLAIVTAPFAVVHDTAAATANPVSDVVMGSLVRSAGTKGDWVQVLLPDDRAGYLPRNAVEGYAAWKGSRVPNAAAFERTAKQFLGVPYLWGGTSSKGFDCSGFAKIVLRMNGIELPRDTDQQAEAGEPVALDDRLTNLQPGDLLFFGTRATGDKPERISHVGIHLGKLEFIHASGFVRRSSLDPASPIYSESLRNRLLRARRVVAGRSVS